MKYAIIIGLSLVTNSCIIDYSSTTSSIVKNNTSHSIQVNAYLNGQIESEFSLSISPYSEIKPIDTRSVKGKSLGSPYGVNFRPNDSVIIIFDGNRKLKHNRFSDSSNCDYCIQISNNRAISNPDNWIKTITNEDKHTLIGFYTYTFTEQDYLDAK